MINKKGYTIKELLIVISIFSVIYLIGVLSVAHAFKYDKLTEEYNSVITLLKAQAEQYAEDKSNALFKEGNTATIYANDLVKDKYFKADDNGNILDPRDTSRNLNDIKIEIIKDNDSYTANINV